MPFALAALALLARLRVLLAQWLLQAAQEYSAAAARAGGGLPAFLPRATRTRWAAGTPELRLQWGEDPEGGPGAEEGEPWVAWAAADRGVACGEALPLAVDEDAGRPVPRAEEGEDEEDEEEGREGEDRAAGAADAAGGKTRPAAAAALGEAPAFVPVELPAAKAKVRAPPGVQEVLAEVERRQRKKRRRSEDPGPAGGAEERGERAGPGPAAEAAAERQRSAAAIFDDLLGGL